MRDVDGFRGHAELDRGGVGNDLQLHHVHTGRLQADVAVGPGAFGRLVAGEARQRDAASALPVGELERAGADRPVPRAVRLHRGLAEDAGHAAIGARQRIEEESASAVDAHHDGGRIGGFHLEHLEVVAPVELRQAAPLGLRVHVAVPAPEHVRRVQLVAVVEAHVAAQPEGVGQPVCRGFDGLGQQGLDVAALAIADQAFHDVEHDAVGVVVAVRAGHAAADVGGQRDDDARGGEGCRAGQQDRYQRCAMEVFHLGSERAGSQGNGQRGAVTWADWRCLSNCAARKGLACSIAGAAS